MPDANDAVIGDLSNMSGMRQVADQANALGRYDAVIHNAGVGYREARRTETADGLSLVFAVNVLAPYLLTALMTPPDRLIYLSSGMHRGGDPDLSDLQWDAAALERVAGVCGLASYSMSCWLLRSRVIGRTCFPTHSSRGGCRRRWVDLALPTIWSLPRSPKRGSRPATDPEATVTGRYFYHQRLRDTNPAASSIEVQEGLLAKCASLTKCRTAMTYERS